MSNLSRREAADMTLYAIRANTMAYINIPDEFINYAAAASLYVTRNFPADDPIWNLSSANARGPEMANAVQAYTNLASKTLSFRFTRQGTWNLTADSSLPDQGQAWLDYSMTLPMPGTVNQYQGYRYIDNGAGGNGSNSAAFDSFRVTSGSTGMSKSGTTITLRNDVQSYFRSDNTCAFEVANVGSVLRFAVTYAYFDDWTSLTVNGRFVRVWNGDAIRYGTATAATQMVLVNGGSQVNIGVAQYSISSNTSLYYGAFDDDLRPYLINGTNTLVFSTINGTDRGLGGLTFDLQQAAGGPALGGVYPDAPGYSAVISGNASRSALVNLLSNLGGKLYNYMVNNVYLINYCHTNCHNNCHSSRGRR